jgi:hypothetical protein
MRVHASVITHRVDGIDQPAGPAELHQALSQVVKGSLHQNLLLLVVVEKVVPQRLLGQGLWVAHNDHPIPENIRYTHTHSRRNLSKDKAVSNCTILSTVSRMNVDRDSHRSFDDAFYTVPLRLITIHHQGF